MGLWALGMATSLKGMGKWDEARRLLHDHLIKLDRYVIPSASSKIQLLTLFRSHFKGITDDYILPTAIYEEAVLCWHECCTPPAELLDEDEVMRYKRRKLEECEAQLETVRGWDTGYTMDARFGMRVQSGFETLAWYRAKMGWPKT
jgi:hypothetical protein